MLFKIFRLEQADPLIWQLKFSDAEVDKIIANRFSSARLSSNKNIECIQTCRQKETHTKQRIKWSFYSQNEVRR